MTKAQIGLIDMIGRDAVRLDWEDAFGGKSYGNTHLFRVNKIAKFLLKKEGGNPFVTIVGAWVHDVSLATGSDYESKRVGIETRKFLDNYPIEENIKDSIVDAVAGHEYENSDRSMESKIVHDADAIDKCGSLGIVRHVWKTTNMLKNRVLESESDLNELRNHLKTRQSHLMTKTANNLVRNLNETGNMFFDDTKRSMVLMKEISELAWLGMNADKIVNKLEDNERDKWILNLSDQLKCKYLK